MYKKNQFQGPIVPLAVRKLLTILFAWASFVLALTSLRSCLPWKPFGLPLGVLKDSNLRTRFGVSVVLVYCIINIPSWELTYPYIPSQLALLNMMSFLFFPFGGICDPFLEGILNFSLRIPWASQSRTSIFARPAASAVAPDVTWNHGFQKVRPY